MICAWCAIERGDDFSPGRKVCRPCKAAVARRRYANDPERFREASRQHRRAHPTKVNALNRKYRQDHPEWAAAVTRRNSLRTKGWTEQAWNEAFERQGGLCAIQGCGRPATDADHDHQTGRARKLLCSGCNKALGLVAESVERLLGLAEYCGAMVVAGIDHIDYREIGDGSPCNECFAQGFYWTEWSDAADRNPDLARLVVERPEPADGTVMIRCPKCNQPPRSEP